MFSGEYAHDCGLYVGLIPQLCLVLSNFLMFQRRYTAPANQAGLKLHSIIGYNGNGRGNMVWQADTGNHQGERCKNANFLFIILSPF